MAENGEESATRFRRNFILLISVAWIIPPVFAFAFFPVLEIFTLEQVVGTLTTPLVPAFVTGIFIFSLTYFNIYIRPVTNWIQQPDTQNEDIVQRRLRHFPLHFWGVFISYLLMAPTVTIISAEIYTDYSAQPIDLLRIYLVALIVSIIAGLPAFFQIFDLFGRHLGGLLRFSRPLLTIKTRVFLIGALIPLLIDTMLVQFYWTRTGYFGWDAFTVWVMLELLAVAGSLLFLRGFEQSLSPLHGLLIQGGSVEDNPGKHRSIIPASTDELGLISAKLADLLDKLCLQHEQLDDAHQAIQKREQYLSLMLNSIGDAVIATDARGLVTRMNPVAEQLTGWTFGEAQGLPVKSVLPIIDATTRQTAENPVDKVLASGKTVHLGNHTTLLARDGTEYQISDSASPIRDANNTTRGVVLVFSDVTEQYRLREEATGSRRDLQAIMDNSPAVIYVKDTDGKYIFVNRQYEALFHTIRKDIIGKTDRDVFSADFADNFQRNDRAVLAAGHALEYEETVPHEDGSHNYLSVKFPLFSEDGKVYAVCGISTDITERKKQEEQLRRSQKMDALGKLTGGVAHDYNNLLGIISGYAELLNEHLENNPGLAKYAQDISRAAERGTRLTQKLLVFSRLKASDEEVVDINALLTEQCLMLEKSLTASVKLKLDLADGLWLVHLDSGDLEDAIVNICINAMHAMKAVGELTIQTCNELISDKDAMEMNLASGEYVLLNMIDTGCGMDNATREKIFDPFFSTKGDKGTGLGLSQVYGFVERSGGAIKVYSKPGKGTRFSLYFPRSQQTRSEEQTTTVSAPDDLRGEETLLVVDDEQDMVELAQTILTMQGYRVLTANDGEQALEILGTESIDLILSDVIMPNMDGYQLAARVRQSHPQTRILITSGFADDHHNQTIDDALYKNVLHKPYRARTLLERVRALLDEGSANVSLTGRTILVVDDEEDVRVLFKLKLEKLGCKTVLADNGDEAIALYRQALQSDSPIDAAILDLGLPGGMGGQEVAEKIRAMDPQARLIVASGHTDGPEMTHYKDFGFRGALEKTFDQDSIKQVLKQALSSG